jgi:hypothetical protein
VSMSVVRSFRISVRDGGGHVMASGCSGCGSAGTAALLVLVPGATDPCYCFPS